MNLAARDGAVETGEERTRGASAADERANEHPPGRRDDHEDGGPTIQLPAASAATPLDLPAGQYTANRPQPNEPDDAFGRLYLCVMRA